MPLPNWVVAFRPHQESAIFDAISHFKAGTPIVMIDAPTGSGKTLIAETIRQAFDWRAIYLCSTLSLQDQFMTDFSYAALLRGRQNYPTADTPHLYPNLTASDCTKEKARGPQCPECDPDLDPDLDYRHCRWCHPVSTCPYEVDKSHAIRSPLVCANLAYFLYESNYVGSLSPGRDIIIVDEADLLEDQLLNFISVSVTQGQQREYKIPLPSKKTVESSWLQWAIETEAHVRSLKSQHFGTDLTGLRKKKAISRLHDDLLRLVNPTTGLAAGNWVYTGYNSGRLEFKPIHVAPYAQEFFWRHGARFLLMSATTISFAAQAEALGLEP